MKYSFPTMCEGLLWVGTGRSPWPRIFSLATCYAKPRPVRPKAGAWPALAWPGLAPVSVALTLSCSSQGLAAANMAKLFKREIYRTNGFDESIHRRCLVLMSSTSASRATSVSRPDSTSAVMRSSNSALAALNSLKAAWKAAYCTRRSVLKSTARFIFDPNFLTSH